MIKAVILSTDLLLWLLVIMGVVYGLWAQRNPPLRATWRKVFYSKRGAVSSIVLAFFVLLSLLDSVHYRVLLQPVNAKDGVHYSNDVHSVLDQIMAPLPTHLEKTYSAPLAAYSYSKEQITLKNGSMVRDYPRLLYGGAHLTDPAKQLRLDRLKRISQSLSLSILLFCLVFLLTALGVALYNGREFRSILNSWTHSEARCYPWRASWITVAILMIATTTLLLLAHYYHVFGTNKIGEDVFYQTVKSVRTAVIIGTLTTLVTLPFALLFGTFAGYFRGWIDDVIQYIYTTLSSIPSVLLIAAAVLMLQVYMANHPSVFDSSMARADIRLLALCCILGITSWTSLCRLLRGETLKLREQEYVQAAVTLGVRHFTIILRHIIPNLAHIVIIITALDFSGLVMAEAVLSYVGVGVDPTTYSWGNMINQARLELARDPIVWWSLGGAFVFMFALVLFANVLADAVRDAFDPRLLVVE